MDKLTLEERARYHMDIYQSDEVISAILSSENEIISGKDKDKLTNENIRKKVRATGILHTDNMKKLLDL